MKTQNRLQFPAISLAILLVFIVTSCEVDKDENKPIVATNEVTAIRSTQALCGGAISSDGGFAVTNRGVCWSTDPNPTTDDNKTTDGAGAGSFTSQITGLQPKTNYYVRAYATNSNGTGYGMAMAFETTIGAAVLTTAEVTEISYTSAVCGGTITSDGGATVTERGVCWSTDPNPTIDDNKTTDSIGAGSFTSQITGLQPKTNYYVRAYATNSAGTGYGSAMSFTTLEVTDGSMTDIDGNIYKTVTIGTQTWMAENLNVTKYNDGTNIPNVTDATAWSELTTGALCDYNNTPSNSETYGKLYNWYAVNTGKLCPTGWHVPSDAEWTVLTNYLGGWEVAGGKLKESGTSHWDSPNTGATNESGFTALPGGYRSYYGNFGSIGYSSSWWNSTKYDGDDAYNRYLNYSILNLLYNYNNKKTGYSVRCVRY